MCWKIGVFGKVKSCHQKIPWIYIFYIEITGIIFRCCIVLFKNLYKSNNSVRSQSVCPDRDFGCLNPPVFFENRNFLDSFRAIPDTLRELGLIGDVEGIKVKRKWLRQFEVTRIGWDYPKNRLTKLKIHPYGQNVNFWFTESVLSRPIHTLSWLFG